MSDNFEWKTEEDGLWVEGDATFSTVPPGKKRPWPTIIVLIAAVLAAGLVMSRQVSRQIQTAETSTRSDILSAHNLAEQASAAQDVDLLRTLISARDPIWTQTREELVRSGWSANLPLLGWERSARAQPLTLDEVTIELAPDLNAAELTAVSEYRLQGLDGSWHTTSVSETVVYRRGAQRWLQAPPEGDYWGGWRTQEGRYIGVTYSTRDELMAERLTHDLNELVARLCTDFVDGGCPSNLHIQLRLENRLDSLLNTTEPKLKYQQGRLLELPALSLSGLPLDEAGYQSLYRAYGRQVVTAVLVDVTGYRCCRWLSLYDGLVTRQLQALDLLQVERTTQADYDAMLKAESGQLTGLLAANVVVAASQRRRIEIFIDFLEAEAAEDVSHHVMLRQMTRHDSFSDWIGDIRGDVLPDGFLSNAYLQFIFRQSSAADGAAPPIPLPADRIQLVCDGDARFAAIYSVDLVSETWSEDYYHQYLPSRWAFVQRLAEVPGSYLVVEQDLGVSGVVDYDLVRPGGDIQEFTLRVSDQNAGSYFYVAASPDGRYLLLAQRPSPTTAITFNLVDLAQCNGDKCELKQATPWLSWSPDGRHTLTAPSFPWIIVNGRDGWLDLSRGDERGENRVELGEGAAPFWLDAQTYGFLGPDADGAVGVVIGVVGNDRLRTIITQDDLLAQIPPEEQADDLTIDWVVQSPADSRRLVVRARTSTPGAGTATYVLVTLTPDFASVATVDFVYQTAAGNAINLSPDARWLVTGEEVGNDERHLSIVDLETGVLVDHVETISGSGPSWSADGNWYVMNNRTHLALRAPEHDYTRLLFHNFQECSKAYWLDE